MHDHAWIRSLRAVALAFAAASALAAGTAGAGNEAKGTIAYKTRTTTLKYAWLVKGPDSMDPKTTIRTLILSADDIGARLAASRPRRHRQGVPAAQAAPACLRRAGAERDDHPPTVTSAAECRPTPMLPSSRASSASAP